MTSERVAARAAAEAQVAEAKRILREAEKALAAVPCEPINERLSRLTERYGRSTIDFFGDTWRIWFQDWHQHRRIGLFGQKGAIGASYGGLAGYGETLDDAMDRLERSIEDVPPSGGFHCREGKCKHYQDDF